MLNYVIQVALGISAFWLLYHLFFKNRAAPATNRIFLMAGLVLPFLIPLISLPNPALSAVEPILLPVVELSESPSTELSSRNASPWLIWFYLGGVVALCFYYANGVFHIFKIMRNAKKLVPFEHVYLVSQNVMPFSFAGKICLPENLSLEQQQTVLAHEEWHLKCNHSLDVFWALVVQTALWFFPLLPFYLRDLKTEHEYEVDAKMLANHKLSRYAETLLQLSLSPVQRLNWHSFSSPNLKNRIIMMTQKPKNNWYKLVYMLPIMVGLLYLNACSETEGSQQELTAPKAISIIEADEPPQFANCKDATTKEEQLNCFQRGMQITVQENFKYPKAAIDEKIEGKLYVGFNIDYNGDITNLEMKRGAAGESAGALALNEAALAVFTKLPKLKPAYKDGQPISVSYIMPINLKL